MITVTAFTKQTAFAGNTDVPAYAYTDMRGHAWSVKETQPGKAWSAYPSAEAATAYNLVPGRMFAAASDAEGMVDVIEERLEAARAAGKSPGDFFGTAPPGGGFPWWLVALGVAAYLHDKKRRRR